MEEYIKLVYPKYYFQKKNPILRFWIIFYFGPNFVFGGTPLGHFSKYYFLFFIVDQPWCLTFLLSSLLPHTHPHPYHKKTSYSPDIMSNLILSSHKKSLSGHQYEQIMKKCWGVREISLLHETFLTSPF